MLNKGPERPGFGLGLKPWHFLRPGTLDHGRQVWIVLGKNPERLWIRISTRRGPGSGYWLLDKDGLGLGCRVRMDMELAKALVMGFGIGHRLDAVKDGIL